LAIHSQLATIAITNAELMVPNLATHTPLWLALLTVGTNGIVGALRGQTDDTHRWDIVGVATFALMMGLGGGFTRDVLLGDLPPESLRTPWSLLAIAFAVLVVLLVGPHLLRLEPMVRLLDGVALGLFAVTGTARALDAHLPVVSAILIGSVSAVGGGVAVSILQGQISRIFVASELYALLAVVGAGMCAAFWWWTPSGAALSGVVAVVLGQVLSHRLKLQTRPRRRLDGPDSRDSPGRLSGWRRT
jgi:uncharacterized membrane protein YeiH